MRLMLFIRSLHEGGAERQLVTLACARHLRGLPVAVMVLYDGPMRAELEQIVVTIIDLERVAAGMFISRMIRAIVLYPGAFTAWWDNTICGISEP